MRALFLAIRLCRGQRVVKIVTNKANLDVFAAKNPGFLDLLLRRGHWHEHDTPHAKMPAHKRDTLRVISRTRAYELFLIGYLAHRVERTAQFVRSHGAKVFALQPYISTKPF